MGNYSKLLSNDQQRDQKWSESGQMSVAGPSEIAKTLSLIGKTHMRKTNAQNLIKPVENEDFLSPNRKMASKMIKKALRL